MFEMNYKKLIKDEIKNVHSMQISTSITNTKWVVFWVIENIDARNTYKLISPDHKIMGYGETEFEAWKNAYYALLKVKFTE